MRDAIREAWVHLITAEMEIRLAGMAHWPFANAFIKIEQRRFVRHFRAWLGWNQATRRRRRGRWRLFPWVLAHEAAGADGPDHRARGDTLGVNTRQGLSVHWAGRSELAQVGDALQRGAGRGFGAAGLRAAFASPSFAFTGEGRDCRPRRWALPITAFRLTPPSSSAIWLAVIPFSHIVLSDRCVRRSRTFEFLLLILCGLAALARSR